MTWPGATVSASVLLVSVDEAASQTLSHALAAATFEVEWAKSYGELRRRAARDDLRTPRLVFLDLELPDAAIEQLIALVLGRFARAATVALATSLSSDGAAHLLAQGVPSITKPVSAMALTGLALRIALGPDVRWAPRPPGARLEALIDAYTSDRVLSNQQQTILRHYLEGRNDKEIAELCGCSAATVYEHWRRMARKVGGAHKGDAIADFHRFLASE